MATRAEIIRIAAISVTSSDVSPRWYMQQPFWDIVFNLLEIAADLFRAYNRHPVAAAIGHVLTAANRTMIDREKVTKQLLNDIQVISKQLRTLDPLKHPESHTKLANSLNVSIETLAHLGANDGEKEHN